MSENFTVTTDLQIAGRLKQFLTNWKLLTNDKVILDIVSGYKLEFLSTPFQNCARETFVNCAQAIYLDNEIQKLKNKGVIQEAVPCAGQFISTVFLTPKADSTFRMILNLKELNEFIVYKHFKMESFNNALCMVTPNCFMGTIDLKDAYYTVPICDSDRKFMRFIWRGQIWEYSCLAMGLSSAPRIFTKLLKPVLSELRSRGHQSVMYIDDCYVQAETFQECLENINETVITLENLGFVINREKSVLVPTKAVSFLGFIICSETMKIKIPDKKIEKIKLKINKFVCKRRHSIREVSELLGMLNSIVLACPLGSLYCKRLDIEKIHALKVNKGNFDAYMYLSDNSIHDLEWWFGNLNSMEATIKRESPSIELFTDASLTVGWGAVLDDIRTGGPWSRRDISNYPHINYLELFAVYLALRSFKDKIRDKHVKLHIDNSTAVACINHFGSTQSVICNNLTRDIWLLAYNYNSFLTAVHIKGSLNAVADLESRKIRDDTEWMLNKELFQKIISVYTEPVVDLFASRINNQLSNYVSWHPDPNACAVDAFTCEWNSFSCIYIFSPFSLIPRILKKVLEEKVPDVIIVVPDWPTASWFPLLMKLCVQMPLVLPQTRKTLVLLHRPQEVHKLYPKLRLLACRISGKCIGPKVFRRELFQFL